MDVGLATFLRGDGIRPDVLAREAEARGYESLFVTEHTHIPVSAGMVARDGGLLEEKYRRTHDPFVALAVAAAATEKLIIGTSVCLVPAAGRHPSPSAPSRRGHSRPGRGGRRRNAGRPSAGRAA